MILDHVMVMKGRHQGHLVGVPDFCARVKIGLTVRTVLAQCILPLMMAPSRATARSSCGVQG